MFTLAILTGVLAVASRAAIGRAAVKTGRVDHFYWVLAAEAYRTQRGLPVRISGKYLMEDEAQAYPPLFGWLLGRVNLARLGIGSVWLLEGVQVVVLGACMAALHAPWAAIVLAAAAYCATPVLVTYNTQLNARILGDLFLFGLFASEVLAIAVADTPGGRLTFWGAAALLTALVIMTHKMTLQLYVLLLPLWSVALGSARPLLAFAAGVLLYILVVGPRFARFQFQAHHEIVAFWQRHWRALGAHQFHDSPIYAEASSTRGTCFHQPGLRGVLKHLRVVVSYAPMNVMLPIASAVSGIWPPAWLLVWLGGIYLVALGTLLVPSFKSLGGGHLYVFNAAAAGAWYVAWLPDTLPVEFVLSVGLLLNAVSLFVAWRIVRRRPAGHDDSFGRALSALAALPKGRVAVFPLQSAEAVAASTHHAVLWGGHGYGFRRLEGFFPVLSQPLTKYLREYEINWILWDDRYWPSGIRRLGNEGVVGEAQMFGHWCLAEYRPR
jgi:hypothetical protein